MTPITIKLGLPPRELHPNSRAHYMVKANAVKRYRQEAYIAAMQALGRTPRPLWTKAAIELDFSYRVQRLRDIDNQIASMKAAQDGLVDAGILANDNDVTFTRVGIVVNKQEVGSPGTELEFAL